MCEIRLLQILEAIGGLGWSLGLQRHALSLNDVFIIFMEHLFSKGRFILGVVLVNFGKASV